MASRQPGAVRAPGRSWRSGASRPLARRARAAAGVRVQRPRQRDHLPGATNQALNFLEQREAVNLTLQVAVAVGALLALLAAADAISGERERGTLESLLLTPVPRRQLVAGKLLAALCRCGSRRW